jgi:hypothetical protein
MKPCDMPVMKAQCKTCPFRPEGNPQVRAWVEAHIYTSASQICHHPKVHGKNETHLCRGARNQQQQIFYRMGILNAPTDEAWNAKWEEVKKPYDTT